MPRSLVVTTLSLAIALAGCQPRAANNTAAAPAPDALPPAQQILDRSVELSGGREAMRRISSMRTTATLTFSGLQGEMVASLARPNRLHVRTMIAGVGEILSGFDGEVGWSIDPVQGPRVLTGRELEEMRERADRDQMLKSPSSYTLAETQERTEFEGRPAWRIRLVRPSGREETEFYDIETGLQIGGVATQQSAMGQATVTTILRDYRRFGPLLLAASAVQRVGPQEITVNMTAVEYDVVPDAIFELPAAIKALVGRDR
ncbi:MAG TPA: hypothetical protein VMM18_09645 [Gemmatimonadaceae bacterium]|nr:hypothetical protein [Gemmatimonadaceae bacterium]